MHGPEPIDTLHSNDLFVFEYHKAQHNFRDWFIFAQITSHNLFNSSQVLNHRVFMYKQFLGGLRKHAVIIVKGFQHQEKLSPVFSIVCNQWPNHLLGKLCQIPRSSKNFKQTLAFFSVAATWLAMVACSNNLGTSAIPFVRRLIPTDKVQPADESAFRTTFSTISLTSSWPLIPSTWMRQPSEWSWSRNKTRGAIRMTCSRWVRRIYSTFA